MDIVGPLPGVDGFKYLLTIVDRFTRWMEAVPLKDITAETTAKALFTSWIARFCTPSRITTDQSRQFESTLFNELVNLVGAKRIHTTQYHPCANGLIKRQHRTFEAALKCHKGESWVDALPSVLLGMRTSLKEGIGASAAELTYGTSLKIPGEFIRPSGSAKPTPDYIDLKESMSILSPVPTSTKTNKTIFVLAKCTHVLVRNDLVTPPLIPPYSGTYLIKGRSAKTLKAR